MADPSGSAGDPGSKPTTEDKIDALHDMMLKFGRRFDSVATRLDKVESRQDAMRTGEGDRPAKPPRGRADAEEGDDDDRKDAAAKDKDEDEAKKDAEKGDDDGDEDDDKKEAKKEAKKDAETDGGEGEEGLKEVKDTKRKDAEEEGGESDPAEMASDAKRKDAKRRDADEDEDDRSDKRHDAAVMRRLEALERNRARPLTDADLDKLAELQHAWSDVAQAHGERVSRPMDGEPVNRYDRRMARRFQKHSERWKKVDLADLPPRVMRMATEEIRADAVKAAYRGDLTQMEGLREIRRQDATGRTISEFVGPVEATLAPFKIPALRVVRINTNPNQW